MAYIYKLSILKIYFNNNRGLSIHKLACTVIRFINNRFLWKIKYYVFFIIKYQIFIKYLLSNIMFILGRIIPNLGWLKMLESIFHFWVRPYHVENTASRQICQVKQASSKSSKQASQICQDLPSQLICQVEPG